MADGRLTVAEYDDRLTRAYAARTYGELAELTADLPATDRARPRRGRPDPRRSPARPAAAARAGRMAGRVAVGGQLRPARGLGQLAAPRR